MTETMPSKPAIAKPSSADERRAICVQALALAQRAEAAGLPVAAYLLDMVALQVGDAFGLVDRRGPPPGRKDA